MTRLRWARVAVGMAGLVASFTSMAAELMPQHVPHRVPVAQLDSGDTAWLLTATALVLLMSLPGLALFYAGMVRRKNILGTLAQVFATSALVSLLWFVCGYSLALRPGTPWLGSLDAALLHDLHLNLAQGTVGVHPAAPTVPESVYLLFQLSFAVITPALIVGAVAERMRFAALLWFVGAWSLLVYVPVAHWVWAPDGWLAALGALDFAGGTVVHLNAGVAGLVAAWWLKPRLGHGQVALRPSNLTLTMCGAALLWVGWIGFNAGSAGAANAQAGMALLNTQMAAAAGTLAWMLCEWLLRGMPTLLGMCSGALAGLVAVTPAAGLVAPGAAVLIGALAGLACLWGATGLKAWLGVDDALDVFGVHAVGGLVGALLTGALADPAIGGHSGSVWVQALACAATIAYSALATVAVLWLVSRLLHPRVQPEQEAQGLDWSQHAERLE